MPREQLVRFYQRLGVFVIPSLQEGLGIVGLEAMACGCPVVSTRCGGPEEYVIEGRTGMLAEPSAAALAGAIETIQSNPALRRRLSEAAVRQVHQRYAPAQTERIFWHQFAAVYGDRSPA
jgi:glycosyltransferase involved in cell wall biosynthesis